VAPEIAPDLFGKIEALSFSKILRQEKFASNPLNALGNQKFGKKICRSSLSKPLV
jgi:hypothetical protein